MEAWLGAGGSHRVGLHVRALRHMPGMGVHVSGDSGFAARGTSGVDVLLLCGHAAGVPPRALVSRSGAVMMRSLMVLNVLLR